MKVDRQLLGVADRGDVVVRAVDDLADAFAVSAHEASVPPRQHRLATVLLNLHVEGRIRTRPVPHCASVPVEQHRSALLALVGDDRHWCQSHEGWRGIGRIGRGEVVHADERRLQVRPGHKARAAAAGLPGRRRFGSGRRARTAPAAQFVTGDAADAQGGHQTRRAGNQLSAGEASARRPLVLCLGGRSSVG